MNNLNNQNNNSNYSESISQKVIDAADIVEIVSEYITLEKKGNDYKGLCPFHNDSNPSLSVSPSKKLFKCFSCNTSGNVISFVSKIENISYKEALKKVADKSGIKLNFKENPRDVKISKYHKIMNEASSVYQFYLQNTKEGEKALEYLYNRNITEEIIRKFKIGLSSHNDNLLTKVLIEDKKYLPIDLIEIGLVQADQYKKNDGFIDLFHGRIMFPITDLKGNIIAFSGRIYDSESNSKYINSRETEIFKKKDVLFNYAQALNDIKLKDEVFVFEGFMDVIAAYRGGINNAIATMGTALTESQIDIISKVTKNIVLCYDGDTPGINAMKRAIGLFTKKNIPVKTICMPPGVDPDDFINKYGKEKFIDLFTNNQISSVDYLYLMARRNINSQDPNSIIEFQREVYSIIREINNSAIEKYLLDRLVDDLKMPYDNLQADLVKYNNSLGVIEEIRRTNNDYESYPDLPDYPDIPDFPNFPNFPPENISDSNQLNGGLVSNGLDYPFNDDQALKNSQHKKKKIKKNIYEEAEKGIIYLSFYNRNICMEVKKRLNADEYIDMINRNILYSLYDYYELAKEMNYEEFIKLLKPLEIEKLNIIINTCGFYSIECLDDFIDYLRLSNAYKEDVYLKEKFEKNNNNEDFAKIIHELAKNKKKLIKIKK